MTPNPTSAPAPQRLEIEDLVHQFARFHAPACKISQQALAGGLMLLADNVVKLTTLRLADEADCNGIRGSAIVAAWLREKAQ